MSMHGWQGPKAVLGPGTGLGEAQLIWDTGIGGYKVLPSEGAHAQFAPRGWRQRALQAYVESQMGYCEVEHVSADVIVCLLTQIGRWPEVVSSTMAVLDFTASGQSWMMSK